MDNSYRLLDLTVDGRQETWEDSRRLGTNGQYGHTAYEWASDGAVASGEGWAFGRSGDRAELSRAYEQRGERQSRLAMASALGAGLYSAYSTPVDIGTFCREGGDPVRYGLG
jgi:hypothetical protein